MNLLFWLSAVGLLGAGVCVGAYVYGYIWKPAGFRWLNILSLFATTVALAQLSFVFQMGVEPGGSINGAYALVFLLISGLAQALMAVKARNAEARGGTEPEIEPA